MNSSELTTLRKAIETGNLETVKQTASETGINLACAWAWITEDAIRYNFLNLLKYLLDDLKINFAENIKGLSSDDLDDICVKVACAAEEGKTDLIKFVVQQFQSQRIFEAAFHGAVRGSQMDLLLFQLKSLCKSGNFEISNRLVNRAMKEACSMGRTDMIEVIMENFAGDDFVLEKHPEDNLDAVDCVLENALEAVSCLLTCKYDEQTAPKSTLGKAEQIVRLLKEYHK